MVTNPVVLSPITILVQQRQSVNFAHMTRSLQNDLGLFGWKQASVYDAVEGLMRPRRWQFHLVRRVWNRTNNTPVVIFAGLDCKRVDFIVAAAQAVLRIYRDLRYV